MDVSLAKIGLHLTIGQSNFCSKLAPENNSGYLMVSEPDQITKVQDGSLRKNSAYRDASFPGAGSF
jgi:hypothetical protein